MLCFPDFPDYNRFMMTPPPKTGFENDATTTAQWQAWDADHVWHPFTPMTEYAADGNPVIVAAEGFELIDTEGRRYLDGVSNLWCNVHGHRVPELDDALKRQVDRVAHSTLLGMGQVESIALARELVTAAPAGLNHVFYSDDGSTAIEAALKIAFQYHLQRRDRPSRRPLYIGLQGAYHGDTVGAVSVGGIARFHGVYEPLLFSSLRLPAPAYGAIPRGVSAADWFAHCGTVLETTLRERHHEIAAFVIEPLVQMAGGLLIHQAGFLARVRELTQAYDIPLIADEVAVAFGRLGTLFACPQEQVTPDLLCLSKGLTGGYLPLAATLVTTPIYEAFLGRPEEGRTFYHGHTYTGNALACAVARASLQRFETHAVLANAARLTEALHRLLSPLQAHPQVGAIRIKGLVAGIEVVRDRASETPYAPAERVGHRVVIAARRRGVMLRPLGDLVELIPAPAMPPHLLERISAVVVESIDEVTQSM
jgi:adenosylmethionine---8-amino-7-oxononanoate aminotransferase